MPKFSTALHSVFRRTAFSLLVVSFVALMAFPTSTARGQADDFVTYGTTISGEVSTRAGEEWFFSGCAGDLVTIEMSSSDFDAYVELYGPASRRPLIEDDNSGGDDDGLIEEYELPESGVYSIVAAGAARSDRGEYTLTLDSDQDTDMSEEPALFYGDQVTGEVRTIRGEEWSFWGCAGDVITLLMENDEFVGYIELYGPTGRRALAELGAETEGATIELSEVALPDSGIYTIVAAGNSRNDRGVYSLSLLASASAEAASAVAVKSTPLSAQEEKTPPTVNPPTSTPFVRAATSTPVRPAVPGLIADFENWGNWQRGEETWGTFTQSNQQVYGGQNAGKFDYAFPANEPRNYLVFQQSLPIAGSPTALNIWVYGDGSGNFLNAWVRDANRNTWQFTFGRIYHTGWRQMSAPLDISLGWPNQAVGNSSGDEVAYPIWLAALVLDGADESQASTGSILVDNLSASTSGVSVEQTAAATPYPLEETATTPISIDQLPAPVAVGYHFPVFKWEWEGMSAMGDVDSWYFDLKIFNNEYSEYPYDVKIVEVDNVVAYGPNQWQFDKKTDFRCGSFWAIQIALRNPDGSYAGPLSPESNRVPSNQGCSKQASPQDGPITPPCSGWDC